MFRLRAHVYWKVPWIQTNDIVARLITNGTAQEIGGSWIAHSGACNRKGKLKDEYSGALLGRKAAFDEWNKKALSSGYFAQGVYAKVLGELGFNVQTNVKLKRDSGSFIIIDILAIRDDLPPVAVQVKNGLSDVIVDPGILHPPNHLHRSIEEHFLLTSRKGMIPVLIAPFIEGSFYRCCDRYGGLFFQTYLQLFPLEEEEFCGRVKKVLFFGNLKAVDEAPPHVRQRLERLRDIWRNRHGAKKAVDLVSIQ